LSKIINNLVNRHIQLISESRNYKTWEYNINNMCEHSPINMGLADNERLAVTFGIKTYIQHQEGNKSHET